MQQYDVKDFLVFLKIQNKLYMLTKTDIPQNRVDLYGKGLLSRATYIYLKRFMLDMLFLIEGI